MLKWTQLKGFFIADLTTTKDPFSLGEWEHGSGGEPPRTRPNVQRLPHAVEGGAKDEPLSSALAENLARMKAYFSLPASQGLMVHEIDLPTSPPRQAAVLYISGMVDANRLSHFVLDPLLSKERAGQAEDVRSILRNVVEEGQGAVKRTFGSVINDLMVGSAAIFLDGDAEAVTVRVDGWPKRAIDRPRVEVTVRGPQESFTEDLRTNLAQIRRRLRTPDLAVELGHLGRISRTDVALIYLKGVTNKRLVAEIRRRIAGVKVDFLNDCGSLMQFIEDRPFAIFPTSLMTERPDRAAAQVNEGFVVILVDNDAHALILPTTMPMMLLSAEDYYLRWPSGTFMRFTRIVAYYVSLLMPALYVALANFRQEMIPTPLLLSIARSRETVPFSVVLEVLLMEGSFELIHEAALRVPTVIGPTIGIVGSLILGQAAVSAGIISPILVIITSATALASFAIPAYELQMATRIWRFFYIYAAAFLGLSGVVLLHMCYTAYLASLRSYGTAFLAPISPPGGQGDTLFRSPIFESEQRPDFVRAQRDQQQAETTRPWWPSQPKQRGDQRPDD